MTFTSIQFPFLGIQSTSTLLSAQRKVSLTRPNFNLRSRATNVRAAEGLTGPILRWVPCRVFILGAYPRKYPPCHWLLVQGSMEMEPLILCHQVSKDINRHFLEKKKSVDFPKTCSTKWIVVNRLALFISILKTHKMPWSKSIIFDQTNYAPPLLRERSNGNDNESGLRFC